MQQPAGHFGYGSTSPAEHAFYQQLMDSKNDQFAKPYAPPQSITNVSSDLSPLQEHRIGNEDKLPAIVNGNLQRPGKSRNQMDGGGILT
ncbi:hypothetical protein FGO68_gene2439 [Halteria grandinella]|uniref:Uncharacterized protein n=1 Tax=Halteria grandinella TaxID=5974 RepID=A0A8J8P1L3_HALGN|nr:hypothetical protein FGO68_gene2439 [Halteria grandinella]